MTVCSKCLTALQRTLGRRGVAAPRPMSLSRCDKFTSPRPRQDPVMQIQHPPWCPGSTIVVAAPSSGVEPALHPQLDLALALAMALALALADLRAQGFLVEAGHCPRQQVGSGSPSTANPAEPTARSSRHVLTDRRPGRRARRPVADERAHRRQRVARRPALPVAGGRRHQTVVRTVVRTAVRTAVDLISSPPRAMPAPATRG